MSLEKWVEYGWLRREPTSAGEIKDLLGIVDRSLADSKVEAVSTDLRFIAAFNAALCVATTALRASGLRTVTQAGHHVKNNRISRTHHKGQPEGHSKIQDVQQQEEQIGIRRCRCRVRSGIGSDGETRGGTQEQHPSLAAKPPSGAITGRADWSDPWGRRLEKSRRSRGSPHTASQKITQRTIASACLRAHHKVVNSACDQLLAAAGKTVVKFYPGDNYGI